MGNIYWNIYSFTCFLIYPPKYYLPKPTYITTSFCCTKPHTRPHTLFRLPSRQDFREMTFFFKLSVEQLLILIDHRFRFKQILIVKKMCLLVSIASPNLVRFSKHDLKWPLSDGCWKLLSVFFIVYIQLTKNALKVHIKNNLWPLGQYIKASVWYFPVMTERTRLMSGIYCSEIKYIYIYIYIYMYKLCN